MEPELMVFIGIIVIIVLITLPMAIRIISQHKRMDEEGLKRPSSVPWWKRNLSGSSTNATIEWDLVDHLLQPIGMKTKVVKLPTPFWKSRRRAVQLTGQNVDEIRIEHGSSDPRGGDHPAKIHLLVILDKSPARKAKKEVKANYKAIKQNKKLGLFGGKVTDIKWVGNRIADSLNQDMELRTKLVTAKEGFEHIKIKPAGKSAVDIEIVLPPTSVGLAELGNMTRHFSSYDRIAKHVREYVATY